MLSRRALLLAALSPLPPRPLAWADLPVSVQQELTRRGMPEEQFPVWLRGTNAASERREQEGEEEHLIYYLLQSRTFTSVPSLEPARCAQEFDKSRWVHPLVQARLRALLSDLRMAKEDPHRAYFRRFLDVPYRSVEEVREQLLAAYARTMRFLYRKEFAPPPGGVSALYQTRGHSTDTQVAANYAVWQGLQVWHRLRPAWRCGTAAVVGPGLDFAPRTDLRDTLPPQSYQPYAVADALLGAQLASAGELRVDCYDINARVIEYWATPVRQRRILTLLSAGGDAEYERYFAQLGGSIGKSGPAARHAGLPLAKSVTVDPQIAGRISATRLNFLTERPTPRYDLLVITNVLLYFSATELLIGLANLAGWLRPGGLLVTNELRPELDAALPLVGLRPRLAQSVRISGRGASALLDAFVLLERL